MSKDGNANALDENDNQEDIRRLEDYEQRSRINNFETLKNEDILNYIKNIEQNCRLEVSSGDEDYAGTKRSSNCSVKCSGTRFRSSKRGKSRVTSGKNKKNADSTEKKMERSCGRKRNASNYGRCSSRKPRFRSNPEFTIQEDSRKDFNTYAKSTYQYPKSSSRRDLHEYREFPPRFHDWYSRRDRTTRPTVAETTGLEIARDGPRRAALDSGIDGSRTVDGKPAKARTFKSLRRGNFDNSIYTYPDIALKTKERNLYYRVHKRREDPRTNELKEKSDVSGFTNQRPLDQRYPDQERIDKLSAHSYQTSSNNKEYKGLISACRYSASRARQSTSWRLGSRSNRTAARLPDASSLSRGRISQWDNETVGPPLKASSRIMRAPPIDESYRRPRESRYKNNTNQRRREPASVLGERESSCCRRLLTGSQRLCEVIRARKGKQLLGCCCEDAEQNETADCCRCPENVNDPTCDRWTRCEGAYRPLGTRERTGYAEGEAVLRETLDKSPESIKEESDFNLSTEENVQFKSSRDKPDDIGTKDYNDKIELEDLEPQVSFPDWRYQERRLNELARKCKESSNDLKRETREALRKKITGRYPPGEGSPIEIRTDKLMPGDFARYDVAKSTCECRELFRDPPAVCLIGSCSCIGSNNRAENNDSDSSERISVACCCCSSASSCDDEDPVKKLETFCEKVKAVNQDAFKTSRSTCCNAARINARQYFHGDYDERDPSEISVQMRTQAAGSIKRGWLTDPTRLRVGKPKQSPRDRTNLETILIYPPRGENGPPLTLYKKSSNVNCRVKGDGNAGFRYSVTYVQKFVSPTWMPSLAPEIPLRETDAECDCSADYG